MSKRETERRRDRERDLRNRTLEKELRKAHVCWVLLAASERSAGLTEAQRTSFHFSVTSDSSAPPSHRTHSQLFRDSSYSLPASLPLSLSLLSLLSPQFPSHLFFLPAFLSPLCSPALLSSPPALSIILFNSMQLN